MKKILFVCGYDDAWSQVSEGIKPSQHMFGLHELIKRYYFDKAGKLHGYIAEGTLFQEPCEVDFYEWKSVKKDVIKHLKYFIKNRREYDLIYDCLNRCSIWIGPLKKCNIIKSKIITMCHHPSYFIVLNFTFSDAYMFFNEEYRQIAIKDCRRKKDKYYVNEWYPENKWYEPFLTKSIRKGDVFFIDNGKTERDRVVLKKSCEDLKIIVNYPGNNEEEDGYLRAYKTNFTTYTEMTEKLLKYYSLIVPVKKFKKEKIGPLGITSFLDAIALCMPIITSDNTCFAGEVEKYNLGIVYETGSVDSLKRAMRKMKNDKQFYNKCTINLQNYKEKRDISKFSKKLQEIIKRVLE